MSLNWRRTTNPSTPDLHEVVLSTPPVHHGNQRLGSPISGDAWAGLAILIVIGLAYFRLVISRYGFGDDFVLLLSDSDLERAYLIDGRPLFAAAQYLVHRPISNLSQLSLLRGVSCLATAAIAIFFFRHTKRLGGTTTERICFAICLGLLPCLHTYVAQANFWLAPCMSVVTLCAYTIMQRTVLAEGWSIWKRLRMWMIAQTLMMLASAAYQPTLSWYWVAVIVLLLDPTFLSSAKFRRQIAWIIGLGLLAFLLCFVAFKSYFILFDADMKERVALTRDPLNKLYWFARIQLPLALNFWHLMEVGKRVVPLGLATISASFIVSGYVRAILRSRQRGLPAEQPSLQQRWIYRTLLIGMVGLLTHTHWLVIADCPQSYRVIAPLGAAVWIGLFWSMIQWTAAGRTESQNQRSNATAPNPNAARAPGRWMFVITVILLVVTYRQSVQFWIIPQRAAFAYMVSQLEEQLTDETQRVHVVRQARHHGYVDRILIESFGSPATERDWMVDAYTDNAIKHAGSENHSIRITHGLESIAPVNRPRTVEIDMRNVATLGKSTEE